jgi:hypothetical protein
MSVVPLTLTLSLLLVLVFVVFFLREHARGNIGGAERDSLLPLGDERPRLARPTATHAPASAESDHVPADGPDHDGCGCRNGLRPPCVGCLKGTTNPGA